MDKILSLVIIGNMNPVEAAKAAYNSADEILHDVEEWKSISKWMEEAKTREMELRKKLSKFLFAEKLEPSGDLPAGTLKNSFLAGATRLKAKVVGKFNYKVLEELRETTLKEAALGEIGDLLVKPKYELSLSVYKNLTDEQKAIVNRMLEVKPGSPELEIEIEAAPNASDHPTASD